MKTIIILIVILLFILLIYKRRINEPFINDYLLITSDADILNETYPKLLIGGIQIAHHAKLDRQNRVETLTIDPPLPELGETVCNKVICPPSLSEISCWKCY